jgi:hypothetical protein
MIVNVGSLPDFPLEGSRYVAQVGFVRVVVERHKRQLWVSRLHDDLLYQKGVLRHRVVLQSLGTEAADFREPASDVLDPDVLRARIVEVQPHAGGCVDYTRFGGPVGFPSLERIMIHTLLDFTRRASSRKNKPAGGFLPLLALPGPGPSEKPGVVDHQPLGVDR